MYLAGQAGLLGACCLEGLGGGHALLLCAVDAQPRLDQLVVWAVVQASQHPSVRVHYRRARWACHEPQHGWWPTRLRRLHARRRPPSFLAWRSSTLPWPWSFPRSAVVVDSGNPFVIKGGRVGQEPEDHHRRTLSRCDSESARRVVKSLTLASSVAFCRDRRIGPAMSTQSRTDKCSELGQRHGPRGYSRSARCQRRGRRPGGPPAYGNRLIFKVSGDATRSPITGRPPSPPRPLHKPPTLPRRAALFKSPPPCRAAPPFSKALPTA